MRTTKTTSYAAIRRWMEHARFTCVKRYGDRVLLSDGAMLTFIPYGALPETLLTSESQVRGWGSETPARGDPDAVMVGLEGDPQVYLSRQLDCLNTVTDTYHLLTDEDGNPVASVSAALLALALPDPFDATVIWRAHASPEDGGAGAYTVSAWRETTLLGVWMSIYDARTRVAFIVRRTPANSQELNGHVVGWDAVERAKGAALGRDLLRAFDLSQPSICERLAAIVERLHSDTWQSSFSETLAATLTDAIHTAPSAR